MAYINYENLPSTATPVNANNLNSMQVPDEGTWTPVIGALNETNPTVEYETQIGNYKKIGKIVFYEFYIQAKITALNGTNNYATIEGLPFSSNTSSSALGKAPSNLGVLYQALENTSDVVFDVVSNIIRLQYSNGSNANKWIVTSGNRMQIAGNGFYFTN